MADDRRTGPYYVILDLAIRDVDRYLTYMNQVAPALEAAGGRYPARGGALTTSSRHGRRSTTGRIMKEQGRSVTRSAPGD
jgi:uncharacterized protein (DUF1330 family)